jgi:DNA-binding NarL/FixJ family response regulator
MRALIVDDHPLIRAALAQVLRDLDPAAQVDTAGDCAAGLARAAAGDEPDLVVLDLHLPGPLSGQAAVKAWRQRFPALPLVVLSADQDRATVLAALGAGAAGFIPKSTAHEVMVAALRLVLDGGRYVPPELLFADTPRPRARPAPAGVEAATLGLTPRQADVLRLLARGVSNKVIGRELGLAERTVKTHVTAVIRALKVTGRTQAALAAARLGLPAADGDGGHAAR